MTADVLTWDAAPGSLDLVLVAFLHLPGMERRVEPLAESIGVKVIAPVDVTDDAADAPLRYHRPGYGLIGMRERVESLGGVLTAGPRQAGGWSVRATIPL